ncbi:hypothetical protein KUTeg_022155 [Tegillarca granosa]|uniref:CHAT domain-containing protein n=1 Tax=Tegillarca granosa TaxID=220873 RepID=A0ABQ9E5E9_TEGGR|nr:hypothetical protein KUTeg_022155 [Tegillarca granosa]
MERSNHYNVSLNLSQSFSMPSLAEGSEPISEQEEFVEMKSLRERGDKAMRISDYDAAIKHYNEALEIDDKNVEVLLARTTAFLEMKEYKKAQKDIDTLLSVEPDNPQVYKLQGLAKQSIKHYKEALMALLTALDLDPTNADELTNIIASVAVNMCKISPDLLDTLHDMDSYKKLSEIGVCLFQAKKYELCIRILEAAQKFQTNQKGITMRVLLTMANSHSALKNSERAITLYQECLSTAIATHEQIYQTKSLVNIATLYLENGDTYQAIVHYEKLLHLEAELKEESGDQADLPDFWTRELQCGLHLNLSIAYKSIGNMQFAEAHAKKYTELVEEFGLKGKIQSESYHNTGMLNEILGNYKEAIFNYNQYLQLSKKNGDKKGMAQAYGCLGSVNAALRNWKLASTYHEQHITIAKKAKDRKMLATACEMLADTYIMKRDYENALIYYEEMLKSCIRTDYRTKATAMCKIGNMYHAVKKYQYSLYFYEQASDLAEDYDFVDIHTMCKYNIACIQAHSTQMIDLEQSQKYLNELILFFEGKIREHQEEDTLCPAEYKEQLLECYDAMQNVLSKLGYKEDCLMFAENYRKRHLTQMPGYAAAVSTGPHGHTHHWELWTIDRINRVVGQQNSTVLYYSLLSERVLVWIIVPGEGIVRFYSGKSEGGCNLIEQIESMLEEFRTGIDWRSMQNTCENKALPLPDSDLEHTRRRNMLLQKSDSKNSEIKSHDQPVKSTQRRLFDILVAPVYDILMKMEPNSPLIIIPDKHLHYCPFEILQDWANKTLNSTFRITCLPSLLSLEKVINNEMNSLRAQDDLDFDRSQSRKGGLNKLLAQVVLTNNETPTESDSSSSLDIINLRKVANPRLVTMHLSNKSQEFLSRIGFSAKDSMGFSSEGESAYNSRSPSVVKTPLTPRQTNQNMTLKISGSDSPLLQSIGCPSPVDKMLSSHTYSTLTTTTSTGTDITSSSQCITQYHQISNKERCLILGNPLLPESLMLHGRVWHPSTGDLPSSKREIYAIASYCDVDPITGPEATKEYFLQEVHKATILHVSTYGCWKEGLLAFSPNPVKLEEGPNLESSYIVTADEILGLKLMADLVVLNVGYSPHRKTDYVMSNYKLPGAFISAGALCVLVCTCPLPDIAMEKFYFHFYNSLQNGCLVTSAAKTAVEAIKNDERFTQVFQWCSFKLIGKDVYLNLNEIRHAMLDQRLDSAEKDVEESVGKEYLNPKSVLPTVPSREESLHSLQKILSVLLQHHTKQPEVVPKLIDLLDSSLKRLHTDDNNRVTTVLSSVITHSAGGLDLLKLLGFHFQAKGTTLSDPYVVYPHWNKDDLLVPTYDALRAIHDITSDVVSTQKLCDILPANQDMLSYTIDLLSITKNAPEIQLKVSDLAVRPLWHNVKVKHLLMSVGFHQIGMLLNFNRTPGNRYCYI